MIESYADQSLIGRDSRVVAISHSCWTQKWSKTIFWSQKSPHTHEKLSPTSQERRKSIEIDDEAKYYDSTINDFIEMLTYFDAEAHLWYPLLPPLGKGTREVA
jgi:hypothetical protein